MFTLFSNKNQDFIQPWFLLLSDPQEWPARGPARRASTLNPTTKFSQRNPTSCVVVNLRLQKAIGREEYLLSKEDGPYQSFTQEDAQPTLDFETLELA